MKKEVKKNPPEFYGVEYLHRVMGGTGGKTRWEDNGAFYNTALFCRALLERYGRSELFENRILDVGCGRGWVVRHLRNMGFKAEGVEYGYGALENSVCNAVWADLTEELPCEDGSYDLVVCLGVLSHLPPNTVQHAIKELHRVSRGLLFNNILVLYHHLQRHHLTIKPKQWWLPKFKKAGWVPLGIEDMLKEWGFNRSKHQWAEVWRKK